MTRIIGLYFTLKLGRCAVPSPNRKRISLYCELVRAAEDLLMAGAVEWHDFDPRDWTKVTDVAGREHLSGLDRGRGPWSTSITDTIDMDRSVSESTRSPAPESPRE
jgi:hypothetical protein